LVSIDERREHRQGVNTASTGDGEPSALDAAAPRPGMMFGYACDETQDLSPSRSGGHRLATGCPRSAKAGVLPYLRRTGRRR